MNFSQRHGIEQVATLYDGFYVLETMFKIFKKTLPFSEKLYKKFKSNFETRKKEIKNYLMKQKWKVLFI